MSLKLITTPSLMPITLAEAKAHLGVDLADDDTRITTMIGAATEAAEQATGRAIMPQVWELSLAQFPCAFALTKAPVASVTNLKYLDSTGVLHVLDPALYDLDNTDDYSAARVLPAYGTVWPVARCHPNAVTLRYQAGYADAAAVPDSIKSWIKLQVGAMFDNRSAEGGMQTYPLGFADRLLDRYKVY